jgi:hypothetical protein
MPIRIRWSSKEYIGIAVMLLGACGLFQAIYIFIAIYLLSIGNYLVIILIPIGVTLALYYGSLIIFESFAQVERREMLRSQFKKSKGKKKFISNILNFPISKPILILFITFTLLFIIIFPICTSFIDNVLSFIIAEFSCSVISLLIANYFERGIAEVKRY